MLSELFLYRFSGWLLTAVWLFLSVQALRNRGAWTGKYRYFLVFLLSIAFIELVAAITAPLLSNNLFLDYPYITIEFVMLGLFLARIIDIGFISKLVYGASIVFVLFQIANAFWLQGLESYNSYGDYVNNAYLFMLSVWALTVLYRQNLGRSILAVRDSWFVLGILSIYLLIAVVDFLYDMALPYRNDHFLYVVLISGNLVKSALLLLYYKGIRMMPRTS
ncbi:hypothetical protein GCM10010967_32640 [Dyadobacter beijingensis]|uniref:Uncharacterized protein n=1 Tax=Dyadobacter beijingensis TaxID=365489 RepID=A0ABQ2I2S4_9BACT|nr:hypothetical protein [Dyadobacter beijingensis]GGM96450.1 hypothetical protein GCM10010967_32640 [Dyadobacter beijingensis]